MRQVSVAVAVIGVVLLAGCLGSVIPDEIDGAADPAVVSESALNDAGYSDAEPESMDINETMTVRNETVDVNLQSWTTSHPKTGALGGGTAFVLFTTPEASVAGVPLNPIGVMDTEQAVSQMGRMSGLENVSAVNESTVSILGETRTVETMTGTLNENGESYDVYVHAARFRHEGDYVFGMAIHSVEVDEWDNVRTLMEGIDHGPHLAPEDGDPE